MLVSALVADGPPSRVVEVAVDGRLELVLPSIVLDELEDVLVRKLRFDNAAAAAARAYFAGLASEVVDAPASSPAVTGDDNDDMVLASAVASGVAVLVTGDRKHLVPLAEYRGVRVLTPQALLAELGSGRIPPA